MDTLPDDARVTLWISSEILGGNFNGVFTVTLPPHPRWDRTEAAGLNRLSKRLFGRKCWGVKAPYSLRFRTGQQYLDATFFMPELFEIEQARKFYATDRARAKELRRLWVIWNGRDFVDIE